MVSGGTGGGGGGMGIEDGGRGRKRADGRGTVQDHGHPADYFRYGNGFALIRSIDLKANIY